MPKKSAASGEPRFPYTTEPKALRRLLTEIPKRPKPPKVTMDTLKAWNVSSNNNARTAINVLKKLGLLGPGGEPTSIFAEFMKKDTGPASSLKMYGTLASNILCAIASAEKVLRRIFHSSTVG